jgi:hypothetical protein
MDKKDVANTKEKLEDLYNHIVKIELDLINKGSEPGSTIYWYDYKGILSSVRPNMETKHKIAGYIRKDLKSKKILAVIVAVHGWAIKHDEIDATRKQIKEMSGSFETFTVAIDSFLFKKASTWKIKRDSAGKIILPLDEPLISDHTESMFKFTRGHFIGN